MKCLALITPWLFVFNTAISQDRPHPCQYYLDAKGKAIYTDVDKMPNPRGGIESLYKRLSTELKYPAASPDSIPGGTTIIKFVVDELGHVSHKEVEKESIKGGLLSAQLFNVVESIVWTPGSCNDVIVPVVFRIPIHVLFQ